MFASICGRLCPAPCERACVFNDEGAPIGIRALERYASDYGQAKVVRTQSSPPGANVAIIGSGPSGLTAAVVLANYGHQVTIFESLNEPGGLLRYGVPEFRLPRKVLDGEMAEIQALGIEIQTNTLVGQSVGLDDLLSSGYKAVLLALGSGTPKFLDIPGTNLGGVFYAEEFLLRVNLMQARPFPRTSTPIKIGNNVAVIGSGYAALDCARMILRFGRKATLILAGTEDEVPIRIEEREYAKEEGLKLEVMVNVLEILGNDHGFVRGLKCSRSDFADPTNAGQWQLVSVPDSEFMIEVDSVILAAGHQPNSSILKKTSKLKFNPDGTIFVAQENSMTSIPGVFACGNIVSGVGGSVVETMADGKMVAEEMNRYLNP